MTNCWILGRPNGRYWRRITNNFESAASYPNLIPKDQQGTCLQGLSEESYGSTLRHLQLHL